MIRINQIKIPVINSTENIEEKLLSKASRVLKLSKDKLRNLIILRRSIDARHKPEIYFSYSIALDIDTRNEEKYVKNLKNRDVSTYTHTRYTIPRVNPSLTNNRPRIVGFGPAGMFAGLVLARAGLRPIILERGESVDDRLNTVEKFWRKGVLNPQSNAQFGEGGAGTFSDGKLNTLVKDKDGRGRFVLEEFIRFGADRDILIDQKPHVGTDKLVSIVRGIREEILSLGGEIRFNTKFTYTGSETYPIILA